MDCPILTFMYRKAFGNSKNHNNDLMKTCDSFEVIKKSEYFESILWRNNSWINFKEVFELQLSYVVSSPYKCICKVKAVVFSNKTQLAACLWNSSHFVLYIGNEAFRSYNFHLLYMCMFVCT